MARHARKKQKVSQETSKSQPLGTTDPLTDDALKDDEERRLESMLFGTKFVPRDKDTVEDDKNPPQYAGNVLNNLLDSDLFFVDDGAVAPDFEQNEDQADVEARDSDAESSSSSTSRIQPPSNPLLNSRKPPAWIDPSDPPSVSLATSRLRKLRDAPTEETLSGREYEARLRRQYERINPEPAWAAKARIEKREEIGDGAGVADLLTSTSGILGRRSKVHLKAGLVELERLRDANLDAQASGSGPVRVVAFHPSERVPVLCVGSTDRRVRLFNVRIVDLVTGHLFKDLFLQIDGHTNPLLQTLHVPSLPLTSQSSVAFHPLGSSLLLTGPRPFFYTHDLQTGTTTRHARGLWGTTFNTINDVPASRKRGRKGDDRGSGNGSGEGMEVTAFSPGMGEILAVAGRGGYVHLVDWKSGAGQVVGSLKCGGGGGGVRSLWWSSAQQLAVLSGDAEVYLWDVGERRCVRRWKDEGGFRGAGRVMVGSSGAADGSGFLAVGSNTGFVNVYGADSFASSPSANLPTPKPLKSIANLTTTISSIQFNHDAQLMAVASQEKKDAMRLIHTPSLTSFANWPTSGTPLGHVTAVDFSAQSEYLAIGNTRGRVLLYHLKDYGV
ncbi:putative U3 small nucleolar RNA-associated protein 18 [Termitomyces sp. J132]|nr:putative U3 small nucleolar RNA-associated protein 18 [Termitomyces sp. J132]